MELEKVEKILIIKINNIELVKYNTALHNIIGHFDDDDKPEYIVTLKALCTELSHILESARDY